MIKFSINHDTPLGDYMASSFMKCLNKKCRSTTQWKTDTHCSECGTSLHGDGTVVAVEPTIPSIDRIPQAPQEKQQKQAAIVQSATPAKPQIVQNAGSAATSLQTAPQAETKNANSLHSAGQNKAINHNGNVYGGANVQATKGQNVKSANTSNEAIASSPTTPNNGTVRAKRVKIRQKNYLLVCSDGRFMVVFPPKWPGQNGDNINPKIVDETSPRNGHWIRSFKIVDRNGCEEFKDHERVVLSHASGEYSSGVFLDKKTGKTKLWKIQDVVAPVAQQPLDGKAVDGLELKMADANVTIPTIPISAIPAHAFPKDEDVDTENEVEAPAEPAMATTASAKPASNPMLTPAQAKQARSRNKSKNKS